jgi:hypothetical protein
MKWLWVVLLLTIAVPAHADALPSPEAARELTEKVMDAISKGDVEHGLALMKPYAVVASVELDAAANKFR